MNLKWQQINNRMSKDERERERLRIVRLEQDIAQIFLCLCKIINLLREEIDITSPHIEQWTR